MLGARSRTIERELCRRSFARFAARFWPTVTGVQLARNRAVDETIAVLQRVADGELWRVLIALPSGVGKSTLLALYAAWRFARDAGHRAIHGMHAATLANTESLRVRRLVESDAYRELFPDVALRADESTVAAWATTHGGAYFAVGVESSLLGRRAHEAVIDDPLDVRDRFSRAAREAMWAWFSESLATRLDGDRAPIIVVHQRLTVDDLIGRLVEQRWHVGPGGHFLELPAEDEDGNLLAPTILGREKLDELRARNPRAFAAMFLMRPSADDGAAISRTAWRFHAPQGASLLSARPSGCATPEDAPTIVTPDDFDCVVVSADMTFGGTRSSNDYCAVHAWGAAGPGRYLLERWTRRATQREQRDAIKAMNERWRPRRILIEKAAGGAGAIEELVAEGLTNIEAVTVGSSKAARLDNVSPTIDLGFAFLPLGAPGLGEFVEQLAGAAAHDDDMDAASQALHWLNTHAGEGWMNQEQRWTALSRYYLWSNG